MKITAIVGSARKKATYHSVQRFLDSLKTYEDIDAEIISLSDYRLEVCRGCKLCTDKGEEFCPLKDDRDLLIGKMKNSEGVVFATPNYSFQVSGYMKVFLDRLGFFFHRPEFFGKTYTSIVSQGVYGAKDIVKYLNFVGSGMGFNVVKGCYFTALEPITEEEQEKIDRLMEKQAKLFYAGLSKNQYPNPNLFELMIFRITRSRIRIMLDESYRDFTHFKEKGWFESDFYYPVKLNALMKLAGKMFDGITVKNTKKKI